jgi:hypothetical protein
MLVDMYNNNITTYNLIWVKSNNGIHRRNCNIHNNILVDIMIHMIAWSGQAMVQVYFYFYIEPCSGSGSN